MLRHLTLFLLFFCGHFATSFAQNYQVDWGPVNSKEGLLSGNLRLLGLTDDAYHLVTGSRSSNSLLSFSLDHRMIGNKSIRFQFDRKDLQLNSFIQTKAGRFAYLRGFDKRDVQTVMLVSPFENQTFGDAYEIFRKNFKGRWSLRHTIADDKVIDGDISNSLVTSIDRSKVGLIDIISARTRKEPEAYMLTVFDENFELLWKKIQVLGYQDRKIQVIQSVVSNDGTIYLLAKLFGSRNEIVSANKNGLPGYSFKVFQITEDDYQTFDVELADGMAPQDAGLYIPDTSSPGFLVGGFYTTEERRSGLKGLFLNKVSVATGEVRSDTYPLDQVFLEGLISDRDLSKDRGLNTSFRIKDFLQFNDGSLGFIAEEYYVTSATTHTSGGMMIDSYTYHSNQIVIPRFSASGEFLNIQKIDKTFDDSDPKHSSYAMALANGKVYLVYNDQKIRSERRDLRKSGRERGRYTDMTVIDENGTITYQETLFTNREIDMTFLPLQSDFSNTHLLLLAAKGKHYKCGLIRLDE